MAPKASQDGSNRNITDFFIPKNRRPANNVVEEHIVVAALSPVQNRAQLATATVKTPSNPNSRHRPRQASLSSSPSEINTLKRKRTSPRITRSQTASPSSFQSTPRSSNAVLVTDLTNGTPTRKSPSSNASNTRRSRRAVGSMDSLSSQPKPLSTEEMAAPPIPPPQFPRSAEGCSAATSFASTSTLSSAPLSSSIPISSTTSSRRVVRGGLKAVTNSDSDDSSDDELADVSAFLPKKVNLTPPVEIGRSVPGAPAAIARKDVRPPDQRAQTRFSKPPPPSPPRTAFKNSSLAKLVAKNEERRLAQERIRAMEAEVEESKQRDALAEDQNDLAFDREAFLEMAVDDDQREEMIIALDRTEALKAANEYHFFLDDEPKWPDTPFPVDSLPDETWSRIYRDDHSRGEACVSGLAAELAERYPLPMNITMWFASQLMHEASETLCEAYVEILRVSSKHHHGTSMSDSIASLTSRYHTRSLFENESRDNTKKTLPKGLQYVLRTLQFCAPASDGIVSDSTPTTTCAAFLDLALLNIDALVRADVDLTRVVSNCIQDMLDELSESSFRSLVAEVLGTLFLPSELPPLVRCRAIASLPCITLRAYTIRRRLALECFSNATDRRLADGQDWQASIVQTLQRQPELQITDDMDYDYLMAMIAVADIAVAHGFVEYSSIAPPPASVQPSTGLTFFKPRPLSDAERCHNQQIDRVVEQLQSMMSRVKDSGTSHLSRTQARSLIEGVVVRLDACVRTRPRPKKSVFNSGSGKQATFAIPAAAAASQTRLPGMRGKMLEVQKERDRVEVVPVDMLSDREGSLS